MFATLYLMFKPAKLQLRVDQNEAEMLHYAAQCVAGHHPHDRMGKAYGAIATYLRYRITKMWPESPLSGVPGAPPPPAGTPPEAERVR